MRRLASAAISAIVPLVMIGLGALAIRSPETRTRKQRVESIFGASAVFIACDITLTLIVAGPTLAIRG